MTDRPHVQSPAIPVKFEDEAEQISRELAKRPVPRIPRSVGEYLDAWARLAHDVTDFWGIEEDYVNELGVRSRLADIMGMASPEFSWWLIQTIDAIDEEFRNNTVLDREDLMWAGTYRHDRWWNRRIASDPEVNARVRQIGPQRREKRQARRRAKP